MNLKTKAEKNIKVTHLVAGSLTGGAARGALWLHLALLKKGVNSFIVTNSRNVDENEAVMAFSDNILSFLYVKARSKVNALLKVPYQSRQNKIFNAGVFGVNAFSHPAVKSADIVHLHWINDFVKIKDIGKTDKKIIWTVRDMWPVTGGCHYSMECESFKHGCGECPQLGSDYKLDLSRYVFSRKKKHYPSDLHMVGISDWMSDTIRESRLCRKENISTIYNNISCDEFFPIEKNVCREVLGISKNKKIILIGSTKIKDFYKGVDKFFSALSFLDAEKYSLCVFGKVNESVLESLGFEYIQLGYLNDNISLRLAYNAADVFVAPSIQEAFGKTLAESLACGTPVVCFDATGPKSIVEHKVDGYKAKPFDERDLALGIEWVVDSPDYLSLKDAARYNALKKFDSSVVADQYIDLYKEILEKEA